MLDTSVQVNAFCRKLELWSRNLKQKKPRNVLQMRMKMSKG
jgi:hypothetical protein